MAMKNKKPSQGRQKIAIAKIAKRSNLQVTFSKRRSGLFKKASELCTLCGAEIAIIIFSPANKPFSFGHPNVDSLLDLFLSTQNHSLESNVGTQQLVSDHAHNYTNASSVHELNLMLTQTENQLEMEKKRGQSLDKVRDATGHRSSGNSWWENPIDELGFKELRMLKAAMEDLKKNVTDQMSKILMLQSCATINSTSPFFTMNGVPLDGHPFENKPTDGSAFNLGYGHGFF